MNEDEEAMGDSEEARHNNLRLGGFLFPQTGLSVGSLAAFIWEKGPPF
jgi:hypothetical protein